ncbi:GMC oxidoreductase [Paraburkholderia sp. J67]|uniref:GMC oxidoreductase n=1 Tax=Paraburkholderia sp. J67 TaxID=2805435 RepID=UPI002ABE2F60|nr:GMC oxidoreductase [Paraburkholderia sp. J67]
MKTASSSDKLHYGYPTPGPQNPTSGRVMDHVFFLSNEGWKAAREQNVYDYVIVGSGFCALGFAERMLKNQPKSRILILERGGFFLPEHFQNLPLPYKNTLGGLSETFPWTLSATTAQGEAGGYIRWQHGMVPFFGGRSTLWSAWCPRPNQQEMEGWPAETVRAARENFETAEHLLRVQPADKIDQDRSAAERNRIADKRPVYGELQNRVQALLAQHATHVPGIYRSEAAPLASSAEAIDGIDFQKYSTPGDLLALAGQVDIATDCVVERIVQQHGTATALQTSRGVLPLGGAKLILAMGTLPPATLVRNSFGDAAKAGERFSAHFITSIVARVPKEELDPHGTFADLEVGACYIAGTGPQGYTQQYHIQLSALWDKQPEKNAGTALRYMPDVVATASMAQLQSSKNHVVFVCAVLGELDYRNDKNWFRRNEQDDDVTTNSLLQVVENSSDAQTWNAMDEGTFGILEKALSSGRIEYWHGSPDDGKWTTARPSVDERRVPALVHESSTLHLGTDASAPVDLDYRLKASSNVYVTGGALWPQGGSWNPTMTMVALAQDLADKLSKK